MFFNIDSSIDPSRLIAFLVFHGLDVLPIFILLWIYFPSFYIIILLPGTILYT